MAEDWIILNHAMNQFLRREKPEVSISTQEFIRQVLETEFHSKVEIYTQLPWDERPGLYSFYSAIKIKNLSDSETYHSRPFHCHEKYTFRLPT